MGRAERLPQGTVTFLFTDIQGSTRLWREYPQGMPAALARHHDALRAAIEEHSGYVFQIIGDAFCAAFSTAAEGLMAAIQAQHALQAEAWGEVGQIRVRMALHSGAAELREGDYTSGEYLSGMTLSRTARLLSAGHGGQVLLSQTARDLLIYDLPEGVRLLDMGEQRLPDLTHAEHLYQLIAPGLPAEFPPLKSLNNQLNNLPLQPNALVGRQDELQVLTQRLGAGEVRLVTLTGIGGTGKTRLALQVAAELLAAFPDGVYFVPLDQLTEAGLVGSAIAQALSLELSGSQSVEEALREHLHSRDTLLVLDNFEHLLPAASLVGALLATCPQLKVLVTSREALRLRGEQEYPLDPLPLPDLDQGLTSGQLSQFASVGLFIQRAQAVRPEFQVDNASAPAVAEMCAYLDGLPLAIELAAARLRMFSPQALLARLKAQPALSMLSGGARDLPARQQTIQNTLAWSYDLLNPEEQALFRRLGVFAGGFTLEAVEAVCYLPGETPGDTVELLTSLVEKSLVRVSEGGVEQPRFTLLFVLRQFTLGLMEQTGELVDCRTAHVAYFLSLAELSDQVLRSNDKTGCLASMEREYDNLREALGWAISNQQVETGLRLAGSLWRFWMHQKYLSEGLSWLERALTLAEMSNTSTELKANALVKAAGMAGFLGDSITERRYLEQSLEIRQKAGDRNAIAESLSHLGGYLYDQGEIRSGVQLLEESIAIYREVGDKKNLADALNSRSYIAMDQADYPLAQSLLEESQILFQDVESLSGIGWTVSNLGFVALHQKDYARARQFFEEGHKIRRNLGEQFGMLLSLISIGTVSIFLGDLRTARIDLEQALNGLHKVGYKQGVAESLEGLAGVAGASGNPGRAARLFGAAEALREASRASMSQAEHSLKDPMIKDCQSRMNKDEFHQAWSAGRQMLDEGLDRVIAYALEPDEAVT